jgi:hypothetical protein
MKAIFSMVFFLPVCGWGSAGEAEKECKKPTRLGGLVGLHMEIFHLFLKQAIRVGAGLLTHSPSNICPK